MRNVFFSTILKDSGKGTTVKTEPLASILHCRSHIFLHNSQEKKFRRAGINSWDASNEVQEIEPKTWKNFASFSDIHSKKSQTAAIGCKLGLTSHFRSYLTYIPVIQLRNAGEKAPSCHRRYDLIISMNAQLIQVFPFISGPLQRMSAGCFLSFSELKSVNQCKLSVSYRKEKRFFFVAKKTRQHVCSSKQPQRENCWFNPAHVSPFREGRACCSFSVQTTLAFCLST